MFYTKKLMLIAAAFGLLLFTSCQKELNDPVPGTPIADTTTVTTSVPVLPAILG